MPPSALANNRWEYAVEQGRGNQKFGRNPSSAAGVFEDVWTSGGDYPWPAVAAATTVVSTEAADTMPIQIFGELDTFEPVLFAGSLNGDTPVPLPEDLFRGFRIRLADGVTPAGDLQLLVGGVKIAEVLQGRNSTEMLIFTVPWKNTIYVPGIHGSTDGIKGAYFELWARPAGGVFHNEGHFYIPPEVGTYYYEYKPHKIFDAGTDLTIRGSATLLGQISADAGGVFVKKNRYRVITF